MPGSREPPNWRALSEIIPNQSPLIRVNEGTLMIAYEHAETVIVARILIRGDALPCATFQIIMFVMHFFFPL